MKLNLRSKQDDKVSIGVMIYTSDKMAFDAIADQKGISTAMLLRSLINNLVDGNIEVEI